MAKKPLIEVTCPHCNKKRMIQKMNQYASSIRACRPCSLYISKRHFDISKRSERFEK